MAKKKAPGPQGAAGDPGRGDPEGVNPAQAAEAAAPDPDDGYIPADAASEGETPAGDADAVEAMFDSESIASFDQAEDAGDEEDADEAEEAEDVDDAADGDDAADDDEDVADEADDTDAADEDEDADEADEDADEADADEAADDADGAGDAASSRPVRRPAKSGKPTETKSEKKPAKSDSDAPRPGAPVKKQRPTRTRAEATAADAPKRTGLFQFIGQVFQELKKVSWPTGPQLARFFAIVLGFVLFMIVFITLLDVGFGWAMLKAFG